MKFGKEFAAQMVQEWQEAYMDYNYLKTVLKDIMRLKQTNASSTQIAGTSRMPLKRRVSLYRAFSGLTSRYRGSPKKNETEEETILVSEVQREGEEGYYQTMVLMASDEGGDCQLLFFRRLDHEFNKVLNFYKKKVGEIIAEADELSMQMDALIALRIKVENPVVGVGATKMNLAENGRNPGPSRMSVIQEVEMSCEEHAEEEKVGGNEEKIGNNSKDNGGRVNIVGFRPASLEVLEHVKLNVDPESPISTIKCILMSSKPDLSFSKEELKKVEELMIRAFVEFYQKLRLVKQYSFLNQLAFSKIMKKYEKITSRNASKAYLKMVDDSYLGSSDEVPKLIERVEATFVKHFSNGNHRKGMGMLRPKAKKEKHRITFSLGLLCGCALALVVTISMIIHARGLLNSPGRNQYMENIFPLYSLFGFIVLHLLMYAANIYFWKRYRVNYSFIFGFKQGTELGYREVLLVSSGIAVLTLAGVISNLEMEMDPSTRSFSAITELVPLGLVIVVLLITFCPFNIIYRSSRFFLIQCGFHCLFAPLYKVTLPDFFLADQLTSQVQTFRSLQFYVCYYGWGDFKRRSNTCSGSEIFDIFFIIVAIIPYWIRSLQCARRLFDEKKAAHALNGLIYFSTIVAVAMRANFELNRQMTWRTMAAVSSGVATIFNTYWDLVIDWGLLRKNSRNPWLRDKLLISNKSVYFVAIVLNILLRLAWMQTVLGFTQAPFVHRKALIAIVACLEILRRGIWNFFRLENEHLNNVGKYRAFKSVPVPFYYDDGNKGV